MLRTIFRTGVLLVVLVATLRAVEPGPALLDAAGLQGGLVVHLGCGDGRLTAALRVSDRFLVQGLDSDPAQVAAARKHIQSLGLYGQVSCDVWRGPRLPYVDNLVNAIVISGACRVPQEELQRVLAPGGVILSANPTSAIQNPQYRKPWPDSIDQWTHYLHGPDNNAVAQDTQVGPPKHFQWIGSPSYLRHHDHLSGLSAMVSARGRLFYIMDLGPRWSVQMPSRWTLIARDAFNGVILWQRPIAKWHPHLWPLKHGPAQIMRRLVAVDNTVYVTLGVGEPITALDAATGETRQTYAGSEGTEELLLSDGLLCALVHPQRDAYKDIPTDSVEAIRSAGRDWNWDEKPRRVAVFDAAGGKLAWQTESVVAPCTLACVGGRIYWHDGQQIVCRDARSGQPRWTSKPLPRWKPMHVMFGPTLVVHDGVVLFAGGEKFDPQKGGKDTMTALSAETGETLWTAPHPASGYASSEDLFVINGLAWCGSTSSPRDTGVFTGRDLRTGEVRMEFAPDDQSHMPHHRCYRSKATCKFLLISRTGIEYVDVQSKHWNDNYWVRGSCNYGVMPCNGLTYAPPHSCACFLLAKLAGFNALAGQRKGEGGLRNAEGGERKAEQDDRLQLAAAAAFPPSAFHIHPSEDWPTYRADMARSGAVATRVPDRLRVTWQAQIGGRLSAPVAAGGRVFVASIDAHTLYCLDADSGKMLWQFTAGARIDSPPTVWQDRAIFGSADGWVYSLRAVDGAPLWRFRAAPHDQRLTANEQLESVWPVSGSVLVREGLVYCVAGRAMWLDDGMRLVRLDAQTGKLISETRLDDKYPGTTDSLQKDIKWPNLPVALPDVLSCDGRLIYMRSQPFDLEGRRTEVVTPRKSDQQRGPTAHLFAATGFLDGTFWHRTYWMWGESFISGAGGVQLATFQAPAASLMVAQAGKVFGFGNAPLRFLGSPKQYQLFACDIQPKLIDTGLPANSRGKGFWGDLHQMRMTYDWSLKPPLIARAMTLAGQTLFVAGPPALLDEDEAGANWGDPAVQQRMAEHVAAFEGRKGAVLLAAAAADGKTRAAYQLDSPPVFDGLIAARERLVLCTLDGRVLCLGANGARLTPADAKLEPFASTASKPTRRGKVAFRGTDAHADFQLLSQVRIEAAPLGYHLHAPTGELGMALRKLETPLTQQAAFQLDVRVRPGAPPDTPGNAFLVFGATPDANQLVQCGFRLSGKSLSIAQADKNRGALRCDDLRANAVVHMQVTVDLAAQKVILTAHGKSVEAKLDPPVASIQWVGCAVHSVDTQFSRIQIDGQ